MLGAISVGDTVLIANAPIELANNVGKVRWQGGGSIATDRGSPPHQSRFRKRPQLAALLSLDNEEWYPWLMKNVANDEPGRARADDAITMDKILHPR
jgi:hypothetical protein